jgi:mRNA interferase HigB
VRIISEKKLEDLWKRYPRTKNELMLWISIVRAAAWATPADVKAALGHRVDFVRTNNGNTITVIDVANNKLRLITAIHYLDRHPVKGRVYILRTLNHSEYDKGDWKDEL